MYDRVDYPQYIYCWVDIQLGVSTFQYGPLPPDGVSCAQYVINNQGVVQLSVTFKD